MQLNKLNSCIFLRRVYIQILNTLPYRPFVDEIVYHLTQNGQTALTTEVKGILIKLLYCDTYFINVTRPLSVGLTMTMASLVKYYAKEVKKISLPLLK